MSCINPVTKYSAINPLSLRERAWVRGSNEHNSLYLFPHPVLLDSGSKLRSTSSIHGVVPEGEGTLQATYARIVLPG